MAAVLVMEKEGVTNAFGVPGAAISLCTHHRRVRHVGERVTGDGHGGRCGDRETLGHRVRPGQWAPQ
jgi:glyoxylate carboligase